ncbi:hypothetical protein CEXT_766361 [Caerostris extrusa]|uniref:Uncharacterized protein n=1 Tax=Caerostris extrusa TaxID=172846 RepID=A0AAV4UD56_CAEEX|nr:hypothetical protein CEXT_766361 [Caerostris extrusa]
MPRHITTSSNSLPCTHLQYLLQLTPSPPPLPASPPVSLDTSSVSTRLSDSPTYSTSGMSTHPIASAHITSSALKNTIVIDDLIHLSSSTTALHLQYLVHVHHHHLPAPPPTPPPMHIGLLAPCPASMPCATTSSCSRTCTPPPVPVTPPATCHHLLLLTT